MAPAISFLSTSILDNFFFIVLFFVESKKCLIKCVQIHNLRVVSDEEGTHRSRTVGVFFE